MSKKLTILDIAKLSGVGKSTVSRVLTNDPRVKPETRAKVERVIEESGYVPSKSAQAMRGAAKKSSVLSFPAWILLLKTVRLAVCFRFFIAVVMMLSLWRASLTAI